jgi:anti-anti-sigma factor
MPHFEWQDVGGIAVVRFTTTILREEHLIRIIFDELNQLVAANRMRIVLNCSGLEAFASYAVGKLIGFSSRLKKAGGRLVLCELSTILEEIVDIMNLHKQFEICATEQEALESFV